MEKAYKINDKTNVICGAITTILTAMLGKYWLLFAIFIVEMALDWITGTIAHKYFIKDENSNKGAQGAIRKVAYIVVIGIAFMSSYVFSQFGEILSAEALQVFGKELNIDLSFTVLIGWLTLAMFMINEFRSILENCTLMGVKVPKLLIYGFDVTKDKMEYISEKLMDKEETKDSDNNSC